MFEFSLASLLFQVAAGAALVFLAAGSAALDLRGRRSARTDATISNEPGVVVGLPAAPRVPKRVTRIDVEAQPEAA